MSTRGSKLPDGFYHRIGQACRRETQGSGMRTQSPKMRIKRNANATRPMDMFDQWLSMVKTAVAHMVERHRGRLVACRAGSESSPCVRLDEDPAEHVLAGG